MITIQTANSHYRLSQEAIDTNIELWFYEVTEQAADFEDKDDPTILDRLQKEITPDCFYRGQGDLFFTSADGNYSTSLAAILRERAMAYPPSSTIYEEVRQNVLLDALRAYAGAEYLEQTLFTILPKATRLENGDPATTAAIYRYFADAMRPKEGHLLPNESDHFAYALMWRPANMTEVGRQKLLAMAAVFDRIAAANDELKGAMSWADGKIELIQAIGYTPDAADEDVPF